MREHGRASARIVSDRPGSQAEISNQGGFGAYHRKAAVPAALQKLRPPESVVRPPGLGVRRKSPLSRGSGGGYSSQSQSLLRGVPLVLGMGLSLLCLLNRKRRCPPHSKSFASPN